ncbi:MAG TPA: hypothetical protein VFE62_03820 [Gemmataceae bacterium]|nr:hypothetical protein [Gemmataceae bacterium]
MYTEYHVAGGEVLTIPPHVPAPPCTCGRRQAVNSPPITAIVIVDPDEISAEEAEQLRAQSALRSPTRH